MNYHEIIKIKELLKKRVGYGVADYILSYIYHRCYYCKKYILDKIYYYSEYELHFSPFGHTDKKSNFLVFVYFPAQIDGDEIYIYSESKLRIVGLLISKSEFFEFLSNNKHKYTLTCSPECFYNDYDSLLLSSVGNLYILSN